MAQRLYGSLLFPPLRVCSQSPNTVTFILFCCQEERTAIPELPLPFCAEARSDFYKGRCRYRGFFHWNCSRFDAVIHCRVIGMRLESRQMKVGGARAPEDIYIKGKFHPEPVMDPQFGKRRSGGSRAEDKPARHGNAKSHGPIPDSCKRSMRSHPAARDDFFHQQYGRDAKQHGNGHPAVRVDKRQQRGLLPQHSVH